MTMTMIPTRVIRTTLTLLASATLLTTAIAAAQAAPADHPPALMALLAAIDVTPPPAALAHAAGESDVRDALYAVAADPTLKVYPRKRAASLLSLFADDGAADRLELLTRSMTLDLDVRWTSTYTLVRGWADRSPGRVLAIAAELLDAPEPLLREATVRGLRWVDGPEPEALVDALEVRETDGRVIAAIARVHARR